MGRVWMLPAALRARIALVALLASFLVPVTTSSLRGLTHVLSCQEQIVTTLTVDTSAPADAAVLGSADTVTRGDVAAGDGEELCGGLVVGLDLTSTAGDRAEIAVALTNRTLNAWQGSLALRVGGATVPVTIGRVEAGATATDSVSLRVEPGRRYEISGTLLVGP